MNYGVKSFRIMPVMLPSSKPFGILLLKYDQYEFVEWFVIKLDLYL